MTKSDGQCLIDSVAAGEVTINLLGPQPVMAVKYALMNSESSDRFGSGTSNTGWSAETQKHLEELVASLERDLCKAVFVQAGEAQQAEEVLDTSGVDGIPAL